MSGFIASLLAREKLAFRSTLDRLENASGEAAVDARFTSELIVKSKQKIRELGLDPDDTTPGELYQALINLASLHDKFLAKKIGSESDTDVNELLPKIVKTVLAAAGNRKVWVIRHSVAKRLLKSNPPKLLMKQLGYRSLDSMIKREDISDLFAGAYAVESSDWRTKLYASYKSLSPSDFESRKLSVKYLSQKKWQKVVEPYVQSSHNNVVSVKELGTVSIMPLPVRELSGVTIMVLPLVLHRLNEIQIHSNYFKFEQVQHNFGQIIADTLSSGFSSFANMCGQDLHWGIVHDQFIQMARSNQDNADMLEPHIQLEDLERNSIEEYLYKLEPALHFWFGTDCLGMPLESGAVSFNIMDVATNYVNKIGLGLSNQYYLRTSLWDELMKRYLSEEPLQQQVVQQIDNSELENEYLDQPVSGAIFA